MKKIIFTFLFFSALLLLSAFPVTAQDKQVKIVVLPQNEVVNKDYLTAGDSVRISGTVNGDVYTAGGTVDIDGTVNGDLLVAGGNILITGVVKNDVRAAGGNITFSGAKIGGNVTVLGGQIIVDKSSTISGSVVGGGGNFSLLGPIGKGLTIGGGQITVGNSVGGDITAGVGTLSLLNDVAVNGKLVYWSENKATISTTATVSGGIKQEFPPKRITPQAQTPKALGGAIVGALIAVKIADLILMLIIGLLIIALFPVFAENASANIRTGFWLSLLIGFIAIIVTPIVAVMLFITLIGIPLGALLLILFFVTLWFSRIFAILMIGKFAFSKSGNKRSNMWAYFLGLIIYFILGLIPVVSFFTDMIVLLTGFGSTLLTLQSSYSNLRTKKLI